mmetsp:Transcript_33857/g.40569  ORF Transcript_33857/g.40569 Transcript_33857/m.40569 type:complete len:144 (+) Transcript_33857:1-432(+)
MLQIKILNELLLIIFLLLVLLPRDSESLSFQFQNRRAFVIQLATTVATATAGTELANAAIDVSGLKVVVDQTPGRAAPNQPPSGPLAGTSLGYKVGGGPRPESEVRQIDEARYQAAGKGPSFLVGVPREPASEKNTEKIWTTR